MMRKNLTIFTKIEKKKPEDCIDIADKRINKKPLNSVRTEKENRS